MDIITNGNAISEGLGLDLLAKSAAMSGLMTAGIKILQIIGTVA